MYSHVACLLFVCFLKGAWLCLIQNIDVKARHFSFLCAGVVGLCVVAREQVKEYVSITDCT